MCESGTLGPEPDVWGGDRSRSRASYVAERWRVMLCGGAERAECGESERLERNGDSASPNGPAGGTVGESWTLSGRLREMGRRGGADE